MRQNIYLGIDGVILTKGVVPALHLSEFLAYILNHYSVSWLSTRCPGSSQETSRYLSHFLSEDCIDLIQKIKPTSFALDKTEAIDFGKEFFWLESQLFDSEKNDLKKNNSYDSWIELDLIKNPNQLFDLISRKHFLKSKFGRG